MDVDVSANAKVQHQHTLGFAQDSLATAFSSRENCVGKVLGVIARFYDVRVSSTGAVIDGRKISAAALRVSKITNTTADQPLSNVGNSNGLGNQNNTTGGSPIIVQPTMAPGSTFNMRLPPTTIDEKKIAQDQLIEDLEQQANYPEGNVENKGPSIIQTMFRSNAPHGLYLMLSKYYDDTILNAPHGADLLYYKINYYQFEQRAKQFDEKLLAKVGVLSQASDPYMWSQYVRYCISRQNGYSADEIKKAGGPSAVPDYDKAESVCSALQTDTDIGSKFIWYSKSISLFDEASQNLLRLYR